ncbi:MULTISPECIES: hypothetical protein [Tenacibaculum]|uniref:hypothetical protein n=1 Tax=Tenacibaculum TaxID=104267 RepID=UPI001F292812|nr:MULTISPECIES: hypothetical protein [Tenacibaculum]MCF2875537.1 hypothetical protein [Tenacibaculum sp. Cn5-1]MCF2935613.1 hypothetical protein [Tenacibaculum sp. Cn5-34]MCG7512173.1 hypothetical protein [Tenacibaculum sp. Cn5-46]
MNFSVKETLYKISCEDRNCYQLDLGYKVIDFTFCQLLAFRKKILHYSSYESIENIIEGDNYILLFAADNKHLLLLDVPQILELRETVLSAFK